MGAAFHLYNLTFLSLHISPGQDFYVLLVAEDLVIMKMPIHIGGTTVGFGLNDGSIFEYFSIEKMFFFLK